MIPAVIAGFIGTSLMIIYQSITMNEYIENTPED
jgi:hypothetical protein